jgi:hypothetical protein
MGVILSCKQPEEGEQNQQREKNLHADVGDESFSFYYFCM